VKGVERLGPELQTVAITEASVLFQVHIPALVIRSAKHVIAGVPVRCILHTVDRDQGRRGEGCGVEPLRLAFIAWIKRYTGHDVSASTDSAGDAARRGIRHREGLTRLNCRNAGD